MKFKSIIPAMLFIFVIFNVVNFKSVLAQAPAEETYLAVAESMPEPIGGLEALNKKITYPQTAKAAHLEGKVFVLAFVNENGDVDDAKLIKGIGMGCDEQVVEAVKKTKFKPAKNKGQEVKAKFPIAFSFKLN